MNKALRTTVIEENSYLAHANEHYTRPSKAM